MVSEGSMPPENTRLEVHRCRFVDWTPSEITAIALSPLAPPNPNKRQATTSTSNSKNGVLAVGRGNGTIELCEWTRPGSDGPASQGWTTRRVLAAPNPSKVDTLAFAFKDPFSHPTSFAPGLSDLRLFSTAGGKDLLEWDLATGTVKSLTDSDAGAIWSICVNPTSTILALGCDDGSVRLLNISNGDIIPLRRLDRVKTRILSLAWCPPHYIAKPSSDSETSDSDDEDDQASRWKDSFIIAGCSDSSVRKWDLTTGRVLERMTTDQVRGEKTLVWAVGVLLDGTVVTGDSLGCVKFWDPLTNTQLSSFQAHDADVLCLTVGPDYQSVYASGVDQRVSEFSLVNVSAAAGDPSSPRWIHTHSRRIHVHDVRCITIWPPAQPFPRRHLGPTTFRGNLAPILVTGGQDMSVNLTACAPPSLVGIGVTNPFGPGAAPSLEDSFYRKMPYAQLGASGGRIVQCATKARYVMCRRETKISIWYVRRRTAENSMAPSESMENGWDNLLDMDLKVDTTVVTSAISDDGRWLAVSDAYETKLFRLATENSKGRMKLRPTRVKNIVDVLRAHLSTANSQSPSTASSAMHFTPDSRKLVIAVTSLVVVLELSSSTDQMSGKTTFGTSVIRSFAHHRLQRGVSSTAALRVIKPLRKPSVPVGGDEVTMNGTAESHASSSDGESDANASAIGVGDLLNEDAWPQISHMTVSADGQWLATSDLRGRTHVFNVDAVQHHCTLPTAPLPVTTLAFDPNSSSHHILVLAFPNNTIQVFDVEKREYPVWARAINAQLPYALGRLPDALAGIVFVRDEPLPPGLLADSSSAAGSSGPGSRRSSLASSDRRGSRDVILWARGWMCKVDLMGGSDRNFHPQPRPGQPLPFDISRKRKHITAPVTTPIKIEDVNNRPSQVVTKYRDMMLVDFLGPREMIVVERPTIDVLQNLRPAYYKPKYGSK